VKIARLGLGQVLQLERSGLAQQYARLDNVGFDFLRRSVERVRLTLPEIVDQVD
jgi:hypothetical protein